MIKIIENGKVYLINTSHIIYIGMTRKTHYGILVSTDTFFDCPIAENPDLDKYVKGILGK